MKFLEKFDSFVERIVNYTSLIQLFPVIIGYIGFKSKHDVTIYFAFACFLVILIISLFYYIRIWIRKYNELSFIRTFFISEDWKHIKKEISFDAISLIGNPERKVIHRMALREKAIFYILKNKKNLTYNRVDELIADLIEDDNLTDFNV